MAYGFSNQQSVAFGSNQYAWLGFDQRGWRAYLDASSILKVDLLSSQGWVVDSTVTIDAVTTLTDVPLNESFVRDIVTGKLHLLGALVSGSGASKLYHWNDNTNNGATWSAAHLIDDGSSHVAGANHFFRVGIVAYNGYISVILAYEDGAAFTTDGLWEVHSGDGGGTWSSPAKLYASPVSPSEPNSAIGPDGTAHVSWYDPGAPVNNGGDLYYTQGVFNGTGWTWQASPTKITTGELWGRPRIFTSNGVVMIVGNDNWPSGPNVDIVLRRSTNNGVTWGGTTQIGTHTGSTLTSHPWGVIDSDRAMVVWFENSTPIAYKAIISTDAGANWGAPITPMTTTATSDAPRLIAMKDLVLMGGFSGGSDALWSTYPLFAPDPAVTSIIDSGTRPDENPISDGGKYGLDFDAGDNIKLVSQQFQRQGPSGSFDRAGDYRNDILSNASYELYLDGISGYDGNDGAATLTLRSADGAKNGYTGGFSSNSGFSINLYVAGAYSSTPVQDTTVLAANLDRFLMRLDLACVSITRYDHVSAVWRELVRWSDATYRSSLRPGMQLSGFTDLPVGDNLGGGQLFAPVNNTAPVISGVVAAGQTLTATEGSWATDLGKTPTRFSYQWQNSTNGITWTDIPRATLSFLNLGSTPSGSYRVHLTGKNSLGSTLATSNVVGQKRFLLIPS